MSFKKQHELKHAEIKHRSGLSCPILHNSIEKPVWVIWYRQICSKLYVCCV